MSGFNKMWSDFLLNESYKEDFKYDPSLKCENNFEKYSIDAKGIEHLLTEAELILLIENREKKFREVFYDKIAALYMSEPRWAKTGKDPKEKYPTEVRVNVKEILDGMVEDHPPRAQNKYLTDMGKMLINTYNDPYGGSANNLIRWAIDIVSAVNDFHKSRQIMKKKSLSDYKTLGSLKKALYNDLKLPRIMKARAIRQKDKEGRFSYAFDKDSHSVVYEDNQFFVVRPFNVQSSCYFGNKTNWCITKTGNRYFNEYTEKDGKIFYFIRDDARNQDNTWARAAIQISGDDSEQWIEGFWDRDNDWYDEPEELILDASNNGMLPQRVYDKVIQAIMDHAAEFPPATDKALEELCDRINEENEWDKSFDVGSLKWDAHYEDYDDPPYASLYGYLSVLIQIPEFVIDSGQEDEYHDFLVENMEDIFDTEDVRDALGYYHPEDIAMNRGEEMDETIQVRFNGDKELLVEMPLWIDDALYTDASEMEGAIDSVSHYFDDGIVEDLVAGINNAIIRRSPDIERSEGYKKVLSLIQRLEDGEEIFKRVFVTYETDRVESFDEDDAKDVILDFTYNIDFMIPFNQEGIIALDKKTQKKNRDAFVSDVIYHLQKHNHTTVLKLFRGIIEKIQRAAYQASLRQVKIDFPNFKHQEAQKVMSTPNFASPYIGFAEGVGIRIKMSSDFEVSSDDLEEVDIAYNYYKYIDDNYQEINKYFNQVFIEYLKRSEFFKTRGASKYFEKEEEQPQSLNESWWPSRADKNKHEEAIREIGFGNIKYISSGMFGSVYKGTWDSYDGVEHAIKVLPSNGDGKHEAKVYRAISDARKENDLIAKHFPRVDMVRHDKKRNLILIVMEFLEVDPNAKAVIQDIFGQGEVGFRRADLALQDLDILKNIGRRASLMVSDPKTKEMIIDKMIYYVPTGKEYIKDVLMSSNFRNMKWPKKKWQYAIQNMEQSAKIFDLIDTIIDDMRPDGWPAMSFMSYFLYTSMKAYEKEFEVESMGYNPLFQELEMAVEDFIHMYRNWTPVGISPISAKHHLHGAPKETKGAGYPGAESILNAIEAVRNITGLGAVDMHDQNVLIRPETKDIVIVDVGMFKQKTSRTKAPDKQVTALQEFTNIERSYLKSIIKRER